MGEGDDEGEVAIDESARIDSIEFEDSRYKTADGIHIGTTVKDAEQKFGKITKIELWDYDGSEHAEFANAPKSYSFTLNPKKGLPETARAGIYRKDEYSTTKYANEAFISGIKVSKTEDKNSSGLIITEDGVGNIRLGMTVAEARKTMPEASFSRSSDGEGVALISVKKGETELMTLYANEEDSTKRINENAHIENIEVWDTNITTDDGIHPQMKLSDIELLFGKVTKITLSEIESREFVEFANQPKNLSFRLGAKNGFAGIYAKDKRETAKYSPSSYILSITVANNFPEHGGDEETQSVTTAIETLNKITKVPLKIPTYFGDVGESNQIFALASKYSTPNKYEMFFDLAPDCSGATACAHGSISGEKLSANAPRLSGKTVKLEKNITGYFTDFECGASCGSAIVVWDENGYRYTVGIKAGKVAELVQVVNSAITNDN